MNDALYIAATGMKAHTSQLDAIAHNVANVSTPGFKRGTLRFGEMLGTPAAPAGEPSGMSPADAAAGPAGSGVRVTAVQHGFAAGELRRVDDPMALAIQGDGFVELQLPDGGAAYIRSTRLEINADRLLAAAGGLPLHPAIHVPADVVGVAIGEDGQVMGRDAAGRASPLGRIELVLFANASALKEAGDGLWQATTQAGEAVLSPAADASAGRLKQGFQEASNVQLVDEMVQLMVAQRAYEMSVKVLQAADEVAGMANNLRK